MAAADQPADAGVVSSTLAHRRLVPAVQDRVLGRSPAARGGHWAGRLVALTRLGRDIPELPTGTMLTVLREPDLG